MERLPSQSQNVSRHYRIELFDTEDVQVTTYDGSEVLAATMWPGDNRALVASLTATWEDPEQGWIDLLIDDDLIGALDPGVYTIQVRINPDTDDTEAWLGTIELTPVFGDGTARPVYCSLNDMEKEMRRSTENLVDASDQTGFAEQRADARDWTDDILLRCDRGSSDGVHLAGSVLVARSGAYNRWLKEQLDADYLMLDTPSGRRIVRANALYAISLILKPQFSGKGKQSSQQNFGARCRREAEEIMKSVTAELDINADGYADRVIDCTRVDVIQA